MSINDDNVPVLLPTSALPVQAAGSSIVEADVLSPDLVAQWRENGYALVSDILPHDLIRQANTSLQGS